MKSLVNSHIIQIVIQALDVYSAERDEIAPVDYMKKTLTAKDLSEDEDAEHSTELILRVCRHEPFLNDIVRHILKKAGDSFSLVVLYCVLFVLDEDTIGSIQTALEQTFPKRARRLFRFMSSDSCPKTLTKLACAYYDLEYVEELMHVFNANLHLIKSIYNELEGFIKKDDVVAWTPTIPQDVRVLRHRSRPPPPPAPTPIEEKPAFSRIEPPKSTYVEDLHLKSRLNSKKMQNREAVIKLKEESDTNAFRCARLGASSHNTRFMLESIEEEVMPKKRVIAKPKSAGNGEPVEIRTNVATVLRQEARIVKKEQAEMKFYDNLIAGACDFNQIYSWQERIRQDEYDHNLLVVKKKHLQGLLTHEEAVLAKHKLVIANKEKMIAFKREKECIERMLQDWKAEQEIQIKIKVEKSHEAAKAAKYACRTKIEKNKIKVRAQVEQSKAMIQQELSRRQMELQNKIQMIKEIRALQSMRELRVKEFDETSTSGLGLLCEMSLAELKERLYILQIEMKRELEARQKAVREKKDSQKQMLENAKATITRYKAVQECRKLPKISISKEVEDDEDILILRKQLQMKREERMKIYLQSPDKS